MSDRPINNFGDNYGVNNFGTMRGNNYFGSAPDATDQDEARYESSLDGYVPFEPDGDDFDVAFSFARPDRDYVQRTTVACRQLGLKVMYDRDFSNRWWGQNFIAEQRKIYGNRSRFFVPFISAAYFHRPIPSDEFAAAMWADVNQRGGYILPVLIGDVRVPDHLLPPHVGFLQAENFTPAELAIQLHRKVNQAPTRD